MSGFSINQVSISGNLTRDPESKSLPSGAVVTSFRIAHNEQRKNGQSGGYDDYTMYFDVTMWNKLGEAIARQCRKGTPVTFEGRLDWREWQDKEGNKRQSVTVSATGAMVGITKAQQEQVGGGGQQQGGGYDQGYGGGGYGAAYEGAGRAQGPPQNQGYGYGGYQQGGNYGPPTAQPQRGYPGAPPDPASIPPVTATNPATDYRAPQSQTGPLPNSGEDDIPF